MLLGDGESAEGSVWEAADIGAAQKLDNLCAIVDVNALGQSGPTAVRPQHGRTVARDGARSGGRAIVIDGHDMQAILDALAEGARDHRASDA